jgi:hypothetical protein
LKRRREQRDRNATCPFCDKDGHTVDDCEEKKRYKQHKRKFRDDDNDDSSKKRKEIDYYDDFSND